MIDRSSRFLSFFHPNFRIAIQWGLQVHFAEIYICRVLLRLTEK